MIVRRSRVAKQRAVRTAANLEAMMMVGTFAQFVQSSVKDGRFVVVEVERRIWHDDICYMIYDGI